MRARDAAIVGIGAALVVAALAVSRWHTPTELEPALESTHAVRIVRRDRTGLPEKKGTVLAPARVRAITAALGIDDHPNGPCPPDYADADFGIVLAGNDVYVRRNVYVFGLHGDAGSGAGENVSHGTAATAPSVVSVTSAGCRVGTPANIESLRHELRASGTLD